MRCLSKELSNCWPVTHLWLTSTKPKKRNWSQMHLSVILTQNTPGQQDRRVVAYAGRSLSPVECRYSQTEREALAIVWAIEGLHMYLYSGHFTPFTGSRPCSSVDIWQCKVETTSMHWMVESTTLRVWFLSSTHKRHSDFLSRIKLRHMRKWERIMSISS